MLWQSWTLPRLERECCALPIIKANKDASTLHAGSNMNLAIDVRRFPPNFSLNLTLYAIQVSGDGKLASWQEASTPGSSLSTRFDGLEIYLVSSDTSTNLTVSTSGLLSREQGSTVKHLNWPIPACITAGNYNVSILIFIFPAVNKQTRVILAHRVRDFAHQWPGLLLDHSLEARDPKREPQ